MEDKNKTYEELVSDLERLVAQIENPARTLADVSKDVKKAMELLTLCREKLRESEEQVKRCLEQ